MGDMSDKKSLAWRAPLDTYREVEALAEENDIKKSDVLRRATEEYLDEDDADSGARSTSSLTILGVVALAIAPTLLATGYTALGAGVGVVAAVYVLLWVTAYDVVLESALADARDELAEVGGVLGFFHYVIFEDRLVDDPDTLIERATYGDLVALGFGAAFILVGAPLAVLDHFGYTEAFVAALGPRGFLAYAAVVVVLLSLALFFFGIWALASLAIASTRFFKPTDDPADA